jgi:hypothetical protein
MAKTKRELDREIKEILEAQAARSGLSKHHRYLLSRRKPSGALGAGYLTPAGWHGDPLTIEDPKLRLAALQEQPAPRFPRVSHATKATQDQAMSIDEIARGMLRRYSSARVAMEMAHWHAMDHAEGSASRARWLRVMGTIERLSKKDH